MDKTQLKRHNLVFVSQHGKDKIWEEISQNYQGEALELVRDVLKGDHNIPGFVRRDDARPNAVAIGFVHQRRLQGNRIRIGAFTEMHDIDGIMTPLSLIHISEPTRR